MASSSASYDTSDIIWGSWRQLPNGQWNREGQDSLGNWYEHNENDDPRQLPSMNESSQSLGSNSLPDISWGPWSCLPNGQWFRDGQDSNGVWYQDEQYEDPEQPLLRKESSQSLGSDSLTDIIWGPWSRILGGQRQRIGRDLSGKWHIDIGDEDPSIPRQPHSTSESGRSSDLNRSTGETELLDSGYGSVRVYAKSSISSKSELKLHGKSSRASSPDANGKGRDIDLQPGVSLSGKPDNHEVRDSGYDLPTATDKERESIHSSGFDNSTVATSMGDFWSSSVERYTRRSKRASKGDSKGHSKSSRTSKVDVKGKGRDFGQPPGVSLFNKPNSNEAKDSGWDLPTAADKTGGSSSSSTAIPDQVYYAPPEEDDDQLPELPTPSYQLLPRRSKSSKSSPRPLMPEAQEDLAQYVVQPSRKFDFGTVFKVMWSEPMGVSRLSKYNKDPVGTGTSISEFGKRDYNGTILYEGIRRFIVIDGNENGAKNGNSICVPIATYHKKGCTKHGVKPQNHGIVYTHDKMPLLLKAEPDLGVPPIRLVVNKSLQGIERLAPESRINYSKHVTIEHNSPVYIIGKIHQEDLETLGAGVDQQWEERFARRRSKKDKKQGKGVLGKEQTSSPLNEDSSRSAVRHGKLSEGHISDDMRQEDHRPDLGPAEKLGSTHRPMPSSTDHDRAEGAEQHDHSSLSQTVGENYTGIHEKPQEPHVSKSSHVSTSDTQELKEETDSRLESLTISNYVIHEYNSHAEGAEVHSTGSVSLPNSPQSQGSSICLTETPSDITAMGQHLTTLQRRQLIVQQLIAYVTSLFQTRTQFRSENTRAHTGSSGEQTRGEAKSSEAESQTTQSSSGVEQPIPTAEKRKASDQPNEEENDEEKEPLSRATKGKQKESQVQFACHFVKRYRSKASCNHNNGWPSVHRVKEHLYRHHRQPIHCVRCHSIFKTQAALETHLLDQEELCALSDEALPAGINLQQEKDLKSRDGLSKLNECEKWRKIYAILFPDKEDEIPEPYFDLDDFHAGLHANKRQRISRHITYHVTKDVTEELKKDMTRELTKKLKGDVLEETMDEVVNEVVNKVVGKVVGKVVSKVVDGAVDGDMDEVCETHLPMQTSDQMAAPAVWPDDSTKAPLGFLSFEDDLYLEFVVKQSVANLFPNLDASNPFMGSVAVDPYYPQDPDVEKHISDSGIGSSGMSQGPSEWTL